MFKDSFKKYKSKSIVPDTSEVIDFRLEVSDKVPKIKGKIFANDIHFCGLKPVSKWKINEVEGCPGLIHIGNLFTTVGHRYWICRSLSSYTKHPHCRLNLDAFDDLKEDEDWWEVCNWNTDRARNVKNGLRWSTLGYHHNWDSKVYSESSRDPFPTDLAALSACVAEVLGFQGFTAQAAIVNFYHQGCTLAGHTDHSEKNATAPLLSFSFGCSAIFLLGGRSLDDKPAAMFLRSGDLVVMSGESRLSYHGVPKILPRAEFCANETSNTELCTDCCSVLDCNTFTQCMGEKFWTPFQNYICNSRINLNIRQVLFSDELRLDSCSC